MNFKIEQGSEVISGNGGSAIVGKVLQNLNFQSYIKNNTPGSKIQKRAAADVLSCWIGLFSQNKIHYENIDEFKNDDFFKESFGFHHLYSSSRFRQITEELSSEECIENFKKLNRQLLQGKKFQTVKFGKYQIEYIPCDLDVSPLDNSKSNKEFVSRTYKGHDGYAPMFAYIGAEGYMLNCELRPGEQHCQKGTPDFIREVIEQLKELAILDKVLLRLDSGNDAAENIKILNEAGVKFIIKRNLRKECKIKWLSHAKAMGEWCTPRTGKTVYTGTISHVQPAGFTEGKDLPAEIAYEVTERSIDKKGNSLLIHDVAIDTYWTNTAEPTETIIAAYHDHGTSEQYHSELKSDMDVERLPSGKFETNALVLHIAMLSFNILREIGMKVIEFKEFAPVSITVKRKRIKTVFRDIINIGCKMVNHSGYYILKFGRNCNWFNIYRKLYLSYC